MSLFDRFKKKSASAPSDPPASQWPQPPAADTMCLVLMDRVLDEIDPTNSFSLSARQFQVVELMPY